MDIAAERSYPTPLANVTLLPMLLMSLMRQKHSPSTAEIVQKEYDYVIVGAGSAGSVVANRLSEIPCVSVLLLEAGKSPPLLTDVPALSRFFWFTDIDWQYKTVPQKNTGALLNNRQVIWPSGKALGGSSVLNGMLYARGNRKNFDQWAAEGAEGWSYEDVLPYFKKMEDNRDPEYVANGYHGVRGPQTVQRPRYKPEMKFPIFETAKSMGYKIVDPNGPFQTGFYDLQSTMRSGQRCSTAKAYLVPAENRTNLDILPNAFVKKVLIKNRRAKGVKFDYEGKTFIVNAKKEVILSAGTINTAQLLMLSGIGPRSELNKLKIPIIADLPVGKNLQDHCSSNVDFEMDYSIQPYLEKLTDPAYIEQYIQNRTGPLGSSDFFNAVAFLKNNMVEPDQDFPDHQISFLESFSAAGLQFGLTPEAQAKIYESYEGKPFYSCFSSLLHPRSRGTVTLQSDNPYDPPLIDPNYFDDSRDEDDLVEGLKVCNRIGNSPALKNIGSVPRRTLIPGCENYAGNEDSYLRCQVRSVIMTASHQVGTVRMGNSKDPRTVVDPELRVKTLKGLRVIDASIMPIIPSGNTNAVTIMLAEKASDIIKSEIACRVEEIDEDRFPLLEEIAFSTGPLNPSDLKLSETQGRSKDSISEVSSDAAKTKSYRTTDKPQYNYFSLNKEQWKKIMPNSFGDNENIQNTEPWNREMLPDFTDLQFLSKGSFFETNYEPFSIKALRPDIEHNSIVNNASSTNTVNNEPPKMSTAENLEKGRFLQPQSATIQKEPEPKPDVPQEKPPVRELSQKRPTLPKNEKSTSFKNLRKKQIPSKYDSLRIIIQKEKPLLLPVNDKNSNKVLEPVQENAKKVVNISFSKSKITKPNSESVSDSLESSDTSSSCEKDFCNSLLNFMKCTENESCQKKVEFALLLFQLLCYN